jgi:FkbM family methyltransferase
MNKYILFDIGANWGHDSLARTRDNPEYETWAFEPTPKLLNHLRETSRDQNFADRYHIVPMAVSDFNGRAKFNIAGVDGSDWGCSSLNTFNDNLDHHWPGREDFHVTEVIEVEVTRLDTWIEDNNLQLEKIDYFHCDTQGSDLRVLDGLGKYIDLVQEGVVECATREEGKLYKENPVQEKMIAFLESKGFEIKNIEANDPYNNEANIHFRRK